jgi:transcriptional regulator with XRE-family HTH domain
MINTDLVNIILGMKVRQARLEANLNLTEFAARCDLSPSYITEIEKGRKYPKTDKILKMAEVLGKSYDELVSIKLAPSLTYLETMLSSPLLQQFPFEAFGLELGDLVNLFTRAPDKASALLHAIFEIGRQYDMKQEHFLRAALRSYQEIRENYFQSLEDAATKFAEKYDLEMKLPLDQTVLKNLIQDQFGYELDTTRLATHETLSNYRSVFIGGTQPKLLINAALHHNQVKFLLARELGYQFLGLKERADTSAPDKVDSFEQVLNDFKASYFAGALLLPRASILGDLQTFFQLDTWSPYRLLNMLEKYDVTPEMLLYRFSELIPQFFGTKLHFLRFHHFNNEYQLVKQLNMNRLLLPSGIGLHEHYCRRWLPMRLLRELTAQTEPDKSGDTPLVGIQISEFLESQERFLSFGFARPLALAPNVGSSVIVGFRVTPDLKETIRFVEDHSIPSMIINETCERCPLTEDQCRVRGAEPAILYAERKTIERKAALSQLMAELRK